MVYFFDFTEGPRVTLTDTRQDIVQLPQEP